MEMTDLLGNEHNSFLYADHHYEIVAKGFVFVHKINGKTTSVFVDEDSDDVRRKSGVLGWQLHVGDGGMRVEIKNIYLKKL